MSEQHEQSTRLPAVWPIGRWIRSVWQRLWSGKGLAAVLIGLAALASMVLIALVLRPNLFGARYDKAPLVALVPVFSTLALSIMTYLMLRASESQVQVLTEQVEGERAALRFQQEEARRSAQAAKALLDEERDGRRFQEADAERSAAAAKALFEESVRTRRDDHAPAVTVTIVRGVVRCQQYPGDAGWRFVEEMPDLFPDALQHWRMQVEIVFVVRNDGPGVAVLDLSPTFSHGDLLLPDDWGEYEKTTRQGALPPGSETVIAWRQLAQAPFWRDQAERGWLPPPVKENVWMLDFTFMTYPPGRQVIDRHILQAEVRPFSLNGIVLSRNQDHRWLNAPATAYAKREYPGLEYPVVQKGPGRG